ncbi:MAG: hypothetical protein JWL77_1209 [Chthonomonadaceae bacterium]|nr:hypothetical protein [Chthonomonadaceae bacterium]
MPELPDSENRPTKIAKLLTLVPEKHRAETASVLEKNDAASLQLLTNIISSEHANRRTRALLLITTGALLWIGILVCVVNEMAPWYLGIAGFVGTLMPALSPLTSVPTALERAAVETAVLSSEKHSIGALLETLQLFHLPPALRKKSRQTLIHLLRSLTPEDADLLTPTQRSQLYRNLNYIQRDSELELRLATIAALQQTGDQTCLGVLYALASGEAATHTAQTVRQAARDCMERLQFRLDFAPVSKISEYTDILINQMQSEASDPQISATCMLALRQLLPQIDTTNYRSLLSERDRDRLYQLLVLPSWLFSQNRYGINEVQEEILRTAHRLADTRALASVRKIASVHIPHPAAKQMRTTARQTLHLLEAQVEREKESKTLLRGASAPADRDQELLRAASPAETATAPTELLRASLPHPERLPVQIVLPTEESKAALLQHTVDPAP